MDRVVVGGVEVVEDKHRQGVVELAGGRSGGCRDVLKERERIPIARPRNRPVARCGDLAPRPVRRRAALLPRAAAQDVRAAFLGQFRDERVQQRRLADTGRPLDKDHAASASGGRSHHPAQQAQLGVTSDHRQRHYRILLP